MTLSRKEFLRRGALSIGKGALDLVGLFGGKIPRPSTPPDEAEEAILPSPEAVATGPAAHCLARSCGCFSCVDHCQSGAISIALGSAIAIDPNRCTGCGSCTFVCPTTPKAVSLVRRTPAPAASATPAAEKAEAASDKEGE
ncbi:4Fe-4S binding protein [Geomesophilobacter sediminis]|uniref:4Fe-4S binding protein n=1 Tax=Geomesophilobacter sediminis TaxID=2798584 RepID=A0A8J7LUI4_9BACT|nr:4Fe-4S binding protein [Geomesophilobacter sediminis]MBJ6724694.1 4Fe-4S binding protein [Geomesophilobacter sediminis]